VAMVIVVVQRVAIAAVVLLGTFGFASRASAQQASPSPAPSPMASRDPDDRWHFRVTPYLWLPTINAQFHFLTPSVPPGSLVERAADVRVGPNSYLSHLNSAIEVNVAAEKGGSELFGDLIYVNVGNASASVVSLSGPLGIITVPINVSTSVRTTSTIATGGFGKEVWNVAGSSATVFLGLRYVNQTASATWSLTGPLGMFSPTGSATGSKSDLEPLIGAHGRIGLGSHWFIPLYGDYGGSAAITTYQWYGGIAHEYSAGAQILVWREMAFFANNDPTGLLQNLHLGGPAFAWSFYL
jgi:hypothetical protein